MRPYKGIQGVSRFDSIEKRPRPPQGSTWEGENCWGFCGCTAAPPNSQELCS
jgi:hypothetical protein